MLIVAGIWQSQVLLFETFWNCFFQIVSILGGLNPQMWNPPCKGPTMSTSWGTERSSNFSEVTQLVRKLYLIAYLFIWVFCVCLPTHPSIHPSGHLSIHFSHSHFFNENCMPGWALDLETQKWSYSLLHPQCLIWCLARSRHPINTYGLN